jgi:hypothetical protein
MNFRRLLNILSMLCLLVAASCVKKSDYETLQKENQVLQKLVDQSSLQLQQTQAQLFATQQQLLKIAELETRLKEMEKLLEIKRQELEAIQATYDKFKADRRSAMVGKKYPQLSLDGGRVLQAALVTAFKGDELSIQHESGFIKVSLSKSSDELRWQACYDPAETSTARAQMLADARQLEAKLALERGMKPSGTFKPNSSPSFQNRATPAQEVRAQIAALRQALNNAHSALAAQNPTAMRGANWNSSEPENSGLINVFAERRAILGISQLDSLAAAIKMQLTKLHDLEASGSR